jgi:beta-lactamase class D
VLAAISLSVSLMGYSSNEQLEPSYHSDQLSKIFADAGVNGAFVLFDVTANRFTYHNKERAETRFIPASTFKIPNSLIGLSTGAVGSVDELLPYGGKAQPFKAWERDMGLREAIKVSNVPVYQELARRIGLEAMRVHVSGMNYGNADIGNTVDMFWLTGPLAINAVEQVQFLARLAQDDLPYPGEIQQQVREITKLDQGDNWVLYGKTGWALHIGWWVGWVINDGMIYSFAVNIDMSEISDAPKRIEIGKAALRIFGLI